MELNIYNSLIIAGIIQGLIFGTVVLFSKKYRNKSIYFLVALILCFSLGNLQYILVDVGLMTYEHMHSIFYLPWASLVPPLLYCFVMTFLYPSKKMSSKEKLLFLPFAFFLVVVFIFKIAKVLGYENGTYHEWFNLIFFAAHEILSVILTMAILVYLVIQVSGFEKKSQTYNVHIVSDKLNWLKITLVLLCPLALYWAYLAYSNIFDTTTFTSFYWLWIGMSILIYWLGHIGIYKYGINEQRKKIRKHIHDSKEHRKKENGKNEHITALESLLVNDKIYLDPNLTMEQIADKLELSNSYLSRLVNAELGMGFTDYLNSFRVQQAKEYLKNPDFSGYTVLAIGLEAGFNSKSAFFKVFKKSTGRTPLQYKKENLHILVV